MQVQLPVVSVEECQQAFSSIKTATIDNRTLCAGLQRGGKDACQVPTLPSPLNFCFCYYFWVWRRRYRLQSFLFFFLII